MGLFTCDAPAFPILPLGAGGQVRGSTRDSATLRRRPSLFEPSTNYIGYRLFCALFNRRRDHPATGWPEYLLPDASTARLTRWADLDQIRGWGDRFNVFVVVSCRGRGLELRRCDTPPSHDSALRPLGCKLRVEWPRHLLRPQSAVEIKSQS